MSPSARGQHRPPQRGPVVLPLELFVFAVLKEEGGGTGLHWSAPRGPQNTRVEDRSGRVFQAVRGAR